METQEKILKLRHCQKKLSFFYKNGAIEAQEFNRDYVALQTKIDKLRDGK